MQNVCFETFMQFKKNNTHELNILQSIFFIPIFSIKKSCINIVKKIHAFHYSVVSSFNLHVLCLMYCVLTGFRCYRTAHIDDSASASSVAKKINIYC